MSVTAWWWGDKTTIMSVAVNSPPLLSTYQRWFLLGIVVATSTLYSMTILVVSVVLPQMQGSLSATPDQISWAMTANILGTAIITPMSGWLSGRFGWRNIMLFCLAGFAFSTILCGQTDSLVGLVIYRTFQGGFGGPIVPLSQAIILSSFPKRQHGLATSIFGMGVVIGPILGPIYGGYLSELYNWRWAFFMIVPVAVAAWVGLWFILHDGGRQGRIKFAWMGFISLSIALTCLQLVLDRGQRLDWFYSIEITTETVVGVFAFGVFLANSLLSRAPLLNLRFLLNRNYALGLIIVAVYGMLNFTPMVMLPPMLKNLGGYPDSIIGILLAGRGSGAVLGFFLANWVSRIDARIGISAGFLLQAWSGWVMTSFNMDVTMSEVLFASSAQGLAVGFIWVPLTVSTFANVDTKNMAETSTMYHLLRNIGSSIFISLSVMTVMRSSATNYSRLSEFVNPFNDALRDYGVSSLHGYNNLAELAKLNAELVDQAQLIGFLNAFGLYTMMCLLVLPIIFMIKPPKQQVVATA
jgi:MFS transporter, DHA2 family, multidrug resistance protein